MLCTIMIKDNDQVKYTLGLHNNLAVITGLAALNKVVQIKFITFCSAHHKIGQTIFTKSAEESRVRKSNTFRYSYFQILHTVFVSIVILWQIIFLIWFSNDHIIGLIYNKGFHRDWNLEVLFKKVWKHKSYKLDI